jgi:hypothetical protein
LQGGWPRYWTGFDLMANMLAYFPLGFLLALGLQTVVRRGARIVIAVLLCFALSLLLEALQSYLPSRVPSNLDLASNGLGGLLGVFVAERWGRWLLALVSAYEHRVLAPLPHAELGITLIGLWLLAQLSPELILFGSGDLRAVLALPAAIPYNAAAAARMEAWGVALNTVAVGLFVRQLMSPRVLALPPLLLFFVCALLVKSISTAVLVGPNNAFEWLTPGAIEGLLAGGGVLMLALLLPEGMRPAVASLALLLATLAINLAPPNPYRAAALAAWHQGHFLNFNGVTRWVSSLWPFLALPYLTWLTHRTRR